MQLLEQMAKSSIANFYYQILKLNKIKVSSIGTLGMSTELILKKTISNTTFDTYTNK